MLLMFMIFFNIVVTYIQNCSDKPVNLIHEHGSQTTVKGKTVFQMQTLYIYYPDNRAIVFSTACKHQTSVS